MAATTSWRSPLGFTRSMARPRLMWAGLTRVGLPSFSAKELFIDGMALSACTMAKPMRWVKETLPPRARLRWLLMTMRLSNSSFTGIARTEVAVGSSSEACMFFATAAAGPRSGTYSVPFAAGAAPFEAALPAGAVAFAGEAAGLAGAVAGAGADAWAAGAGWAAAGAGAGAAGAADAVEAAGLGAGTVAAWPEFDG